MAAGINDTFRQVGVAVGIAALGAIFVGRGADKVAELTAGTSVADGDQPRQLIEAASSGSADQALAAVPPGTRDVVQNAVGHGFITGLNEVLVIGGLLSVTGALLALWLVREREIEREPVEPQLEPDREPVAEAAPA